MTSPTNNASSFNHYLESTNEPKTLHGVQILVDDWQRQSVFGMPNPNILPQTFIDKATGQTLQNIFEQPEDTSFGERTPTPSPPLTPKPKGKAKEVEEVHDDPMSDDIYEDEKPVPGLSRPKLTLAIPQEQGKGQDNLATGAAGSSHVKAPKQELKGAASRLQAIQEALKVSGHLQKAQNSPNKSSHGGSPTGKIPTTAEPSTSSTAAAVEENYILDYFRFINIVNSDNNLSQLIRQSKDHADLHKGFIRHEVYRHVQRELQPFTQEAYEIQTEYTNAAMNIMDLMARQKDHEQRLQEFYKRLGQSAEHAIREIPTEPFRERYPTMFNRRPAAVIAENQRNRPAPSFYPRDSGRATPPNQRYDLSNPRWSVQSPHFRRHNNKGTSEWFSTWTPREEYKNHQCNFCRLYGHIRWNCPQYACPHCRKACGHKPAQCPKRSGQHDGRDPEIRCVRIEPHTPHPNVFKQQPKYSSIERTMQIMNPPPQTAVRGRGHPQPYMRMTTRPHRNRQQRNTYYPRPQTPIPPPYEENLQQNTTAPDHNSDSDRSDPRDRDWDDSILMLYGDGEQ
jgi:hypothetical protein